MLTSSACEAPLMAPESAMTTIEAMIAAGHFGRCCALAPRRVVSGAGTLLPARLTSSGNRHHGMIASHRSPRKCFSRVSANSLPRRCKIAARLEARFGLRVELGENYGAPPDKISRWSGDRWYRNFIRGWPSYGSGISGTNASCQANCVGIAALTSFPAKKLDFRKNAPPTEYLPFRVLGPPQKKAAAGREDTGDSSSAPSEESRPF